MVINVLENNYKININNYKDQVLIDYLQESKKDKYLVITDKTVYHIYGERLKSIMKDLNYKVFVIEPGETSKSIDTYVETLQFLSENNFSRSDKIIAFGGGVVGDLAGFVAATYLRGIEYISVPTTLLSMVDSSVGGKTGINFSGLKNQVGSFHFPVYVHIDTSYLDTLDPKDINNGLAEVYKYGILTDRELFDYLTSTENLNYEKIIKRSLEIKLQYVKDDEKDLGKRQFLNLGHTIGHGIETLSNHRLNHGESVAIGIIEIAKISEALGIGKDGLTKDIIESFEKHQLPTSFDYLSSEMTEIIKYDKKIKKDHINLILPVDIGHSMSKNFSLEDLEQLLKLGIDHG